jgi:hypothetical protein
MKADEQAVTGGPEHGGSQEKVLLTLVVPTRNEAENIPELVRENLSDLDYRVVHPPYPDRYRPPPPASGPHERPLNQLPSSPDRQRRSRPWRSLRNPKINRTFHRSRPQLANRIRQQGPWRR